MTIRSTTLTAEGRKIRSKASIAGFSLLAAMLVIWVIFRFGSNPVGAGPDGSVFVTDVNGSAGLLELLEEREVPAAPALSRFDSLDGVLTVVILDPLSDIEITAAETTVLEDFVESGGRLVLSGNRPPSFLGSLLPADIAYGYRAAPAAPILFPLGGVGEAITTDGVRSIRTDDPSLPLAGDPAVAAAFAFGSGEVIYISDGSVFHNRRLVDNAAWILSILGSGPVIFDEVRHGFEVQADLDVPVGVFGSLPSRVRETVWLLLAALAISIIIYGRRREPVEQTTRSLMPPRMALVDAVAGLQLRTDRSLSAAEPVVRRVEVLLRRELGLTEDESLDSVDVAKVGFDQSEVAAALRPSTEDDVLTAHRLLTVLNERNPG